MILFLFVIATVDVNTSLSAVFLPRTPYFPTFLIDLQMFDIFKAQNCQNSFRSSDSAVPTYDVLIQIQIKSTHLLSGT
jgi:hypothetical protein